MELMVVWAVLRARSAQDPWEIEPSPDKCREGMCAGTTSGTRDDRHMRWRSTGLSFDTVEMIAKEEQQKG
ncbi:hypothetical protein GCM10027280_63280 [Micromonospora polyrhachis]